MKRVLIVGHKGQDGRILSKSLRGQGHYVFGVGRGDIDLTDPLAVGDLLKKEKPDEIYYLAAYHHSSEDRRESSDAELFHNSFDVHVLGVVSFLNGMQQVLPGGRIFYAASSHVFGKVDEYPQNELTPFRPVNIYGISKCAGMEACRYYRKMYGVHASCGILYNHESGYRSEKFVSKKIVAGALAILLGKSTSLSLGNLDARIDWGYAPDYVEAMQAIIAEELPDDYIIATGLTHSVREFVEVVFSGLGLNWEEYVTVDKELITKNEKQGLLVGDFNKLNKRTGWEPKTGFSEMIRLMLKHNENEN